MAISLAIVHMRVVAVFASVVCLAMSAMKAPAGQQESSPTLELLLDLPDGAKICLYERRISVPYKVYGHARTTTNTLCFLECWKPGSKKPVRIWERAYLRDFKSEPLGRPTGFSVGLSDGLSSPVALVYWECTRLYLCEINPARPVGASVEKALVGLTNKEFTEEVKGLRPPDWASHPSPPFFECRPHFRDYLWDAFFSNPPRVTKIWRDGQAWNIQIAVGQPEMHLQLCDGTREWAWVNKP